MDDTQNPEFQQVKEQENQTDIAISTPVDPTEQTALVEALIFAHGEPLALDTLCAVSGLEEHQVREAVNQIRSSLLEREAGIELLEVGGKYQFRTRAIFAPQICELKAGRPRRLSGPALETLSIVAYRQPIVRSDIEKLRGVDVTPTIKTLLERKLIRIVGHQESVGQPALYGTTDDFLKIFGLSSLSQLPTLRDLKEIDQDPGESQEESASAPESGEQVEESASA